jgi:hypothetical protein
LENICAKLLEKLRETIVIAKVLGLFNALSPPFQARLAVFREKILVFRDLALSLQTQLSFEENE